MEINNKNAGSKIVKNLGDGRLRENYKWCDIFLQKGSIVIVDKYLNNTNEPVIFYNNLTGHKFSWVE